MSYVKSILITGEQIQHEGHFHWTDRLVAWILFPVGVGIFLIILMRTTEMAVTNRRLIYKRGWIARKTEELGLQRVGEVNLVQGILGRLLNYGKVQVRGLGRRRHRAPDNGKSDALQESVAGSTSPGRKETNLENIWFAHGFSLS